jgi:hypothetical protein
MRPWAEGSFIVWWAKLPRCGANLGEAHYERANYWPTCMMLDDSQDSQSPQSLSARVSVRATVHRTSGQYRRQLCAVIFFIEQRRQVYPLNKKSVTAFNAARPTPMFPTGGVEPDKTQELASLMVTLHCDKALRETCIPLISRRNH